jgi:hypothetical protein
MKTPLTIALLLVALRLFAAEWYVDAAATGGTKNGTSWSNAWTNTAGSITWSSINAGDTLWIQGNSQVYSNLTIRNSEGANNGFTVRVATNATQPAVFSGYDNSEINDIDNFTLIGDRGDGEPYFKFIGKVQTYTNGGIIFRLRNSTNVLINCIEATRQDRYTTDDTDWCDGVKLSNAAGANDLVVITNCYIHHLGGDGIAIDNPGPGVGYDRYKILRCRIDSTADDAVQASGNISMIGCTNRRLGQINIYGGHQDGIQTAIGGQYIWLQDNFIQGYTQCFFLEEAAGPVYVLNNIAIGEGATNGSARGYVLSVGASWVAGREYVASGNIAARFQTYYGVQSGSLSTSGDEVVKSVGNFIFYDNKYNVAGTNWVGTNNIVWYSPGVKFYDAVGNEVSSPSDQQWGLSQNVDPKFVNYAGNDFRLQADSPARDTALEYAAVPAFDRTGVARGSSWDIGPYEYGVINLWRATQITAVAVTIR